VPARGYVWGSYTTDGDQVFALRVDRDYFGMPERGWTDVAPPGAAPLPRMARARRVIGVDDSGNQRYAICATTTCDLWTGAVGSFTIQASDQTDVACVVIGRQAERILVPHA
jgi:hypothetical protein